MKRLFYSLFFALAFFTNTPAQNVTRTYHKAALTTDAVTTGTITIRKPDYISIATNGEKELLVMDGTKFTMTLAGKRHTTDSSTNPQFSTFHRVLKAVINNQPVAPGDDVSVSVKNGRQTITITPAAKKRQLFTSFVLVVDAETSAISQLRMNGRGGDYTNYQIQ